MSLADEATSTQVVPWKWYDIVSTHFNILIWSRWCIPRILLPVLNFKRSFLHLFSVRDQPSRHSLNSSQAWWFIRQWNPRIQGNIFRTLLTLKRWAIMKHWKVSTMCGYLPYDTMSRSLQLFHVSVSARHCICKRTSSLNILIDLTMYGVLYTKLNWI